MRQKKCKVCEVKFRPEEHRPDATVCSVECALVLNLTVARRKWDLETKRRQEELKTVTGWMKDAQRQFNRYIKARDDDQPCISCGKFQAKPINGYTWDTGHYLGRDTHPELALSELNCHRQHSRCNRGAALNGRNNRAVTEQYRANLINRIGIENVEWLEGKHAKKDYTIEELKQIKAHYAKLANNITKYNSERGNRIEREQKELVTEVTDDATRKKIHNYLAEKWRVDLKIQKRASASRRILVDRLGHMEKANG